MESNSKKLDSQLPFNAKSTHLNIAVVLDCIERVRFFSRLKPSNNTSIFALSEHKYLSELCNFETITITTSAKDLCLSLQQSDVELERTLDYHLKGKLNARLSANNGVRAAQALSNAVKLDFIFIWNGAQAFASGISEYARTHGIKTIYFEIGNVPNKIFIDPIGVNCKSNLYKSPSLLDNIILSDKQKDDWLQEYTSLLSKGGIPKQRLFNKESPSLLRILKSNPLNFILNIAPRLLNNHSLIDSYDDSSWHQTLPDNYIFVPLQVSTDTQLILNSKIDNQTLLKNLVVNNQENYVVKFHPCDNKKSINRLKRFISKYKNFTVNQGSTYSLIKGAHRVVTINSTVGLEALFLEKPVDFHGQSVFASFDLQRAIKYASTYLFDLDYFSNSDISQQEIEKIIHHSQKFIN